MIKITPDETKVISRYVADLSGVVLDNSKAYLMEARLSKLAEEVGCASYSELYFKAKSDTSKAIERKIVDAITTGETSFFRDNSPFELLQHKILPDLIDKRVVKAPGFGVTKLRIWSAASSTGQEVYSIAMILKELLPDLRKYDIKLLGTDISDDAIARASYGKYNKFELERGLSRPKLEKYFNNHGDTWRIKDEVRGMADFKKQNLLKPFIHNGKWDIVLCRNVAIYFKLEDRQRLFNKIASIIEPDGYLLIGASEHLAGVCARFEPKRYLKSIFYQLKG